MNCVLRKWRLSDAGDLAEAYWGRGIMTSAIRQEFTVHALPYAVGVCRHLGFMPTGGEQTVNGLRFTPMRYGAGNADGNQDEEERSP